MTNPNDKLQSLENNVNTAQQAMHKELMKVFPEGLRVECYLQKRQKNPSTGTVIWRMPSGFTVRVQLDTVNSRGNQTIRDVHWSRVFPV